MTALCVPEKKKVDLTFTSRHTLPTSIDRRGHRNVNVLATRDARTQLHAAWRRATNTLDATRRTAGIAWTPHQTPTPNSRTGPLHVGFTRRLRQPKSSGTRLGAMNFYPV